MCAFLEINNLFHQDDFCNICQNFSTKMISVEPIQCHRGETFLCGKHSYRPQRHLELCTKYQLDRVFG